METVFESIFGSIDAFVYRCRNDADYTMESLAGGVRPLLGYSAEDLIDNATVSYVGLVLEEDTDEMVKDIDLAIENKETWDVSYRVRHKDGHAIWLRERGNAVFEDGELVYLQGLIVGASAEVRLREDMAASLARTTKANKDVLAMTENITGSVRELSMLSINARIEAARSGEAGLGFAVVANEMKALAERNAVWADKITERLMGDQVD